MTLIRKFVPYKNVPVYVVFRNIVVTLQHCWNVNEILCIVGIESHQLPLLISSHLLTLTLYVATSGRALIALHCTCTATFNCLMRLSRHKNDFLVEEGDRLQLARLFPNAIAEVRRHRSNPTKKGRSETGTRSMARANLKCRSHNNQTSLMHTLPYRKNQHYKNFYLIS